MNQGYFQEIGLKDRLYDMEFFYISFSSSWRLNMSLLDPPKL